MQSVTLLQIQKIVERFLRKNKRELRSFDRAVGVSRGGLIPAALIATRLHIPLIALYIDRSDRVYVDRRAWLRGKRVLLIDDIVRTGKTLKKMVALVKSIGVAELKTFTLYTVRSARYRPTWTHLVAHDRTMPWD